MSGLQNPILIPRNTQLSLPGHKSPHGVASHFHEAFVGVEYFGILLSGVVSRGE